MTPACLLALLQKTVYICSQDIVVNMIENHSLYRLAKQHVPQSLRNQVRSSARSVLDCYAGIRGLDSNRAAPDFLIVGAQKAGTTSLFNWLVDSGLADTPLVKEVGYFDTRWNRPVKYRGYFNARQNGRLVGEATPSYLAFPEVAGRVAAELGTECKIIMVLREPVSRAVSHYFHECRLGFEKRDMYTAMTEEAGLIEEAFDQSTSASRRKYILTHCSYIYRSMYSSRIRPWLDHFDIDNLHLIKSEHMFKNPGATVKGVADFLSVEVSNKTHFLPKNTNSYEFKDARVAEFLEKQLSDEIALYNTWNYLEPGKFVRQPFAA